MWSPVRPKHGLIPIAVSNVSVPSDKFLFFYFYVFYYYPDVFLIFHEPQIFRKIHFSRIPVHVSNIEIYYSFFICIYLYTDYTYKHL